MESKIKQSEFLTLLKWTQGVVEKRSTMPILSNILLSCEGGKITVSATDLEIGITARASAEATKDGRVVVNARSLFEIVKESPAPEIRLQSTGSSLEVTSGTARFKVVAIDPAEFPTLPTSSGKSEVPLDAGELEGMIAKTYSAISTDETRPALNGLYLTEASGGEKGAFRVVATDGHRLSYVEREAAKKWKLDKGIIVPRKAVGELRRLLAEGSGELTVSVDDKAITFRRGEVSLFARLAAGEFPAYEQIIPKKVDKVVSIPREGLAGALRRAAIVAQDQGRGVLLSLTTGGLEVSATNPDLGEAHEEVPCQYKGSALKVAFNPRYLIDILAVLEDEKVVLELKDELSPCVIRSEFDRGFLALVMPMRV